MIMDFVRNQLRLLFVAAAISSQSLCALALTALWLLPGSGHASDDTATNNLNFGFNGPETYPIDSFIGELRSADLDGDGLNDLIIVNNSRSKINLLYNQTGKTNRTATLRRVKPELNELPPIRVFALNRLLRRSASLPWS
jgi:hypothetical protein